jgi:hypothetical protein
VTAIPSWYLRVATGLATALIAALAITAIASAGMVSTKLGPTLCETTGGGKFVPIPDFPGERTDRRLLNDIRFLEKRYKIFITDSLSTDPVHAANGEHPIGLALDIVPNTGAGGTWNDIDRLANWAEPKQNQPRAPFRWVGYDGDSGHGRGNHLHLSFAHSETKPGVPAQLVDTIRCPNAIGGGDPQPPTTQPDPPDEPDAPTGPSTGGATAHGHQGNDPGRDRDRDRDHGHNHNGPNGPNTGGTGSGTIPSGGVSGKLGLAPPVPETGGEGF